MKKSPYKSGKQLAFLLMTAFVLFDVTALARAGVNLSGVDFALQVASSQATRVEGQSLDRLENVMVGFNRLAQCFVAMLFIIWMRRMHKNLWALGARGVGSPSSSCLYSWAIPLLNLIWPFLIMNEIWKASDPQFVQSKGWRLAPMSSLLLSWWGSWVVYSVLEITSRFIARTIELNGSSDLQFLTSYYFVNLVTQLSAVISSVLSIFVVLRLTRRQDEKRHVVSSQSRSCEIEESEESEDESCQTETQWQDGTTAESVPTMLQTDADFYEPGPITRFEENRRLEHIERQEEERERKASLDENDQQGKA